MLFFNTSLGAVQFELQVARIIVTLFLLYGSYKLLS